MPELPEQFLNSLEDLPHFDRAAFAEAHRRAVRETAVRPNPFKPVKPEFSAAKPVPWCPEAYYLDDRPVFTLDPLFHAGAYYVQEPGSMFLDFALRAYLLEHPAPRVLDLCAAPGGKSTLLNSLTGEKGLVVSNEIVKNRVSPLVQNLSKWGTLNTVVTNNDAAAFSRAGAMFDVLVIDAPCSGSGLFRKQPEAVEEWSQENVQMCSRRQRSILEDSIPVLNEGGFLFYSTCSYSREENEEVVEWLLREKNLRFIPLEIHAGWGIIESGSGYRFYPDKTRSEGFFCALLQKESSEKASPAWKKNQDVPDIPKQHTGIISEFIDCSAGRTVMIHNRPHFVTDSVAGFLSEHASAFYVRKAGQFVGEIKGRDLVPSQELAWSIHLNSNLNKVELSLEESLKYLKKQGFSAKDAQKGVALVTYRGLGLGWAKVLEGRINNYLPNELRVLMQ